MKKGILAYNTSNQRYGVVDLMDLWINEGLHCGARIEVLVEDDYVPMHLEMTIDGDWYLTDYEALNIYQLENLKVKIN